MLAALTDWEGWPWAAFYFPLGFAWAWLCLRARSLWFFSASNPTLAFGGFEGEGKREMYEQLPPGSFPPTVFLAPNEPFEEVFEKIAAAGLRFPFAAKPDVGMKGLLFRVIEDEAALRRYHELVPVDWLAQEFVQWPIELSVFYVRHPLSARGRITGITQKELLEVRGDGRATLGELAAAHPRAERWLAEVRQKHGHRWQEILPDGHVFRLSDTGNRNRGARLHSLKHLIDKDLEALFDRISSHAGPFFYGRYDLKCASLDDLRRGQNFAILEFNGAGAAPNHIYHCGLTLGEAYAEMLRHWRDLFDISRHNHRHGSPHWPFWRGWRYLRAARRHFKNMEQWEKIV